jgi:predicted MPP superfamily phosphohydrolase
VKSIRAKLCKHIFKDERIPSEFDGMRIIFLTDIHYGLMFHRLNELVNEVNDLKPDLILLGGDYTSNSSKKITAAFVRLARLKAPKYGVLGNHDYMDNGAETRDCMKKANIKLLENTGEWITKGQSRIKICGVGDYLKGHPDIMPAIVDTNQDDLVILLCHNPNYAKYMPPNHTALMLCGHTHGGQVFGVMGIYRHLGKRRIIKKYLRGIVKENDTSIIISNGIGKSGVPIRIGAPAQVWEITLKNSKI